MTIYVLDMTAYILKRKLQNKIYQTSYQFRLIEFHNLI